MADKKISDLTLLDEQPADTDVAEIERPGAPGTPYRVPYLRFKQTGAQIKAAYEAEADTNAFTDAEQAKLAGIAAGAEVNPDVVPQAEAEAGVATTERTWTAERVGQAIAALAITDAELLALAGLVSAADRLPYFTGAGTAALTPLTAAGRALVDDADADAQLATLGGAAATGSGGLVRATSPTLVTPALGTPASGNLANCTGLPVAGGGTGASTAFNARGNLGLNAVYLAGTFPIFASAALYNQDGSTGRAIGLKIPFAMTITAARFVCSEALAASDVNYHTLDIRKITSAGLATAGTSLCSSPYTTSASVGNPHPSMPFVQHGEVNLGVNQNLTVAAGDYVYMVITQTGSPTALTSRVQGLVIEGTRTT